ESNLVFPIAVKDASAKIDAFVSPDLRHHKTDAILKPSHDELSSMAYELYRAFTEMSAGDKDSHGLIDGIAADFAAYQKKWNVELVEQIRYLNKERADYRLKFFQIYNSWSWLLAKPFWLIEKVLRKY
ncbi:MAG: hypothetical protein L0H75_09295, partial [Nitrosospira sp.]|nr:hypothetical protein [Nitrosospira sp.]